REKAGGAEINILRGGLGWERFGNTGGGIWIGQVCHGSRGVAGQRIEKQVGCSEERSLSIELQIVFAFEYVVEHAEPAADAGLAVSKHVPGEADARRPIVLIGEIRALGRAGIAGKIEA